MIITILNKLTGASQEIALNISTCNFSLFNKETHPLQSHTHHTHLFFELGLVLTHLVGSRHAVHVPHVLIEGGLEVESSFSLSEANADGDTSI